jgi:diamine N-acetyltransferase
VTSQAGPALSTRVARVGDYTALAALWRDTDELHARLLPTYFRRAPGPPKSLAEVETILAAPDETVLVAEDDAGLCGLVHALLYDTPPIPAMTPSRRAHVDSLVVRSDARRRGVGSRLMDEITVWARAKGASEVVLTVWAGNVAAERFYAELGFAQVNQVLGKSLI